MVWLGAVGGGAFILVSLVLGARLLRLAARTRELPETCMGLGLLAMGGLGYPLAVLARMAEPLPVAIRVGLGVLAQALMLVGLLSIASFNWRVFRPEAIWAAVLVASLGLGFLGLFALQCLLEGFATYALRNEGIFRWSLPLVGAPLWWACFESLRYRRLLRRRCQLGLADPVVANRVGLWGSAALAAAFINLFSTVSQSFGIDPATSPLAGAITGSIGMVAAAALFLAFFPPESYRRGVAARAAR